MRHLSLGEIVDLHEALIEQTGGAAGIRDLAVLSLRLRSPARRSMAAICTRRSRRLRLSVSLALNHPFVDGNKRVAHASDGSIPDPERLGAPGDG